LKGPASSRVANGVARARSDRNARVPLSDAWSFALFAELKNQIGLRRLRLRVIGFIGEQFFLGAAAQNLR
jgi:hypothetical protein